MRVRSASRRVCPFHLLVIVLLLGLAACGGAGGGEVTDPPDTPAPGPATSSSVIAGGEQSAVVGTELPNPVVIRVVDAEGRPVSNQLVNFVPLQDTAGISNPPFYLAPKVFAGSAVTDADGKAQEYWTLGSSAKEQTLEARIVDPVTGAKRVLGHASAFGLPGAVFGVIVTTQNLTVPVGTLLQMRNLVWKAYDRYTNTVTDYTLGFTLWTGLESGDPVETPGDARLMSAPFDGWLYLWLDHERYNGAGLQLHVVP
jgi:hypothetical protein